MDDGLWVLIKLVIPKSLERCDHGNLSLVGGVKIYGKQLVLGRLLAPFNLMGFTSNEKSYVVLLWFYCDETYSTEKKYLMEQILD